jgi:glucans biosynthesis protein C
MRPKKKELSVETLRGLAIILMVAGHIIGGSSKNGMKVANDSEWRYFYFTFEYLRMPLFTVISGYVYSLWPIADASVFKFLKGKARRIILPMVSVGTVHFLIQYFVPGTNAKFALSEIWKIYIFPYEHFWFLQSIFLIFVSIAILDHLKLMNTITNCIIIFLITALVRNLVPLFADNFFSINGFFNLLPFFILGCGIQRFENIFSRNDIIRISLIAFIITVALQQLSWFSGTKLNYYEYKILSICLATAGIILLFYFRRNITFISSIGYYAFGIYLYHVFGSAGSRILLMKFGITKEIIMFSTGLIFGIGFPVLVELTLEKSKVLRRVFLGLR